MGIRDKGAFINNTLGVPCYVIFKIVFLFIDFREREERRGREEERENIDLLLHPSMHSLVDSCMCPDWGLNLQTWGIG